MKNGRDVKVAPVKILRNGVTNAVCYGAQVRVNEIYARVLRDGLRILREILLHR